MPRITKEKAVVLDYDDTICDFLGFLCRIYNKLNNTCISPTDITEYCFDNVNFKDVRGNEVTGDQLLETFEEYEKHGLYAAIPLLPESLHALNIMRNLGYKLIILTARPKEYEKQTMLNILHQNVPYDEVLFCPSDEKAKMIRKLSKRYNIQMFADDKASTIEDVYENCNVNNVVIITKPHNVDMEIDEDIIRVQSLFDSVRYLKEIKEKS